MSDTKHGWVTPRADGARARCGGPGVCATCDTEAMHEAMLTGVFGVVPTAAAAPGTPPASAQDDAKDERTRVMEIIAGVWDRATQIDDAADEVIDLLRAPAAGDARDAARYRWLREQAQQHQGRAPAVVLCDESDLFQKGDAGSESGFVYGNRLDLAIDESMAASQEQEG